MILELLTIIILIIFLLPFIYQEKLVRYLKKSKPEIYKEITPNPLMPVFIKKILPLEYFNLNTIIFIKYLFTTKESDDNKTKKYKKIIVYSSMIIGLIILLYTLDELYF